MADAGRILIMPKGTYDASTTYELLDIVRHNDIVWLAKKESIGIEPSDDNSEYWFKMVEGNPLADNLETVDNGYALDAKQGKVLSDMIAEIINGIVTVENAKNAENADSLGGETAEEWQGKIDEKLDKSGGEVSAPAGSPLTVTNSAGQTGVVYQIFKTAIGNSGALGFNGVNNPCYINSDLSKIYALLHTGNRPTGTYTGNGNATAREIATGGTGVMLVIKTGYWTSFVFSGGTFSFNGLTKASEVTVNTQLQYQPSTGKLTLWTTDEKFNASGAAYGYTVV